MSPGVVGSVVVITAITVVLSVHWWYMTLPSTWRLKTSSAGWESYEITQMSTSLWCWLATRMISNTCELSPLIKRAYLLVSNLLASAVAW